MSETKLLNLSIPGAYVELLSIAYNDFLREEYNIQNFKIKLIEHEVDLEIVFVPKQVLKSKPILGGRTSMGREIHYIISKDKKEIADKHFSR